MLVEPRSDDIENLLDFLWEKKSRIFQVCREIIHIWKKNEYSPMALERVSELDEIHQHDTN